MKGSPEPGAGTYTEAELASLFATYFGDKLTPSQLDSLVATVAEAHARRRARTADAAQRSSTAPQNAAFSRLLVAQEGMSRFFGGFAPA